MNAGLQQAERLWNTEFSRDYSGNRRQGLSIISGAVLPVLPAVVDAFRVARETHSGRCNRMTVLRVETSDCGTKVVGILLPPHIKARFLAAPQGERGSRACVRLVARSVASAPALLLLTRCFRRRRRVGAGAGHFQPFGGCAEAGGGGCEERRGRRGGIREGRRRGV